MSMLPKIWEDKTMVDVPVFQVQTHPRSPSVEKDLSLKDSASQGTAFVVVERDIEGLICS